MFNLQIRPSKRLTIVTNRTVITICCSKSYVNVVSVPVSQDNLWYCTYPSCDDVRWKNAYMMRWSDGMMEALCHRVLGYSWPSDVTSERGPLALGPWLSTGNWNCRKRNHSSGGTVVSGTSPGHPRVSLGFPQWHTQAWSHPAERSLQPRGNDPRFQRCRNHQQHRWQVLHGGREGAGPVEHGTWVPV